MKAPHDVIADLHAERDAERKAWAKYVKAAIDDRDATFAEEQDQAGSADWRTRTIAELEMARQGLADLGVDVDDLLGEQR